MGAKGLLKVENSNNEGRKKQISPGMKNRYWMGPVNSDNEWKREWKSIIVEVWWDKEKDTEY